MEKGQAEKFVFDLLRLMLAKIRQIYLSQLAFRRQ